MTFHKIKDLFPQYNLNPLPESLRAEYETFCLSMNFTPRNTVAFCWSSTYILKNFPWLFNDQGDFISTIQDPISSLLKIRKQRLRDWNNLSSIQQQAFHFEDFRRECLIKFLKDHKVPCDIYNQTLFPQITYSTEFCTCPIHRQEFDQLLNEKRKRIKQTL